MKTQLILASFVASALSFGAVGSASAATCGSGSNFTLDTSDVQITSIGGVAVTPIDASDCSNRIDGNDIGAQGTLLSNLNDGSFGGEFTSFVGGWSIFDSTNDEGGAPGDAISVDTSATPNTWTVDFSPEAFSVFALSLKAANFYAVYLFDLATAGSEFGGSLSVAFKNNGGNIPNLSHLTAATFDSGNSTVVPLPAAGWLLLTGLAGLGFAARRRKAA